ncbi:hypothetical protein [Candidatus Nanogingivalis gingivitcus]|jgi:hypothetical protein|uniref:Secreted protein n=1 Tax=Candidatus Nanogingivalis gingivitcus TaxID=2171992 RepID=A0ABY0FIB2_9BACT|nr:hypothetical protein [Candidatus Nanogingivalis gingivitcus]RYC72668.1 hypothetical protein G6CMJM_00317 [Candidatus Nanogingivalis gingivitcus]
MNRKAIILAVMALFTVNMVINANVYASDNNVSAADIINEEFFNDLAESMKNIKKETDIQKVKLYKEELIEIKQMVMDFKVKVADKLSADDIMTIDESFNLIDKLLAIVDARINELENHTNINNNSNVDNTTVNNTNTNNNPPKKEDGVNSNPVVIAPENHKKTENVVANNITTPQKTNIQAPNTGIGVVEKTDVGIIASFIASILSVATVYIKKHN